jgi:hypothetical protein
MRRHVPWVRALQEARTASPDLLSSIDSSINDELGPTNDLGDLLSGERNRAVRAARAGAAAARPSITITING